MSSLNHALRTSRAPRRVVALIAVLSLIGCAGRSPRLRGSDEQFYQAQLLLEEGHTLEAIEAFEQLRTAYPGSRYVDAAIYGIGRAHFERGDHIVAATHFERVVRDFPNSIYRPPARFKLARCYDQVSLPARLDQRYTILAVEQYSLYLVEFPDAKDRDPAFERLESLRARLAEKEILTAEFYNRRDKYEAALLFLDEALDRYRDTPLADRGELARSEALIGLGRTEEARTLLESLSETASDSEHRSTAIERLRVLDANPESLAEGAAG
ncbi:MAG: hypothetical protein CME06_00375 [Gemmatimonadetes bacterium]|nr:hypothetical protein [Gemmatimonadota bacterium]